MVRMSVNIELRIQDGIEPMLAEILSHFRCDGYGECCRNAPATFNDMLNVTFGICVGADVLNQKECKAGLDLIKKINPLAVAGGT